MVDGGTTSLWAMMAQAGWSMVPLYVCSLIALAVTLRKAVEFKTERVGASDLLDAVRPLLGRAHLAQLEARCAEDGSPLGRAMAATAVALREHPGSAAGEAERASMAELARYDAWIPVLSFVAQAAPLFGLLGTVLGMVDLFSGMEAAGSEVSTASLSAGIWKALLTTAAGLVIAIQTLAAHLWFTRQLEALQLRLETGVGRVLDRAQEDA